LRKIIKPKVEEFSRSEIKHYFAISPERVDPGNKKWNLKNTPRLYSGLTSDATKLCFEFYSTFCDELIETSTPEAAELAKLFENTFRQVNIALVNELTLICHGLGVNVNEVISAAASKPYGFMEFRPGLGVGGHCIPVDPTYLAKAAEEISIEPRFIKLANEVNLSMPSQIIKRIKSDNSDNLKGNKILVVGISYKPNISDLRESPSLRLLSELRREGAQVSWYDPLIKNYNGEHSSNESNFDIAVIATLHDSMDLREIINNTKYILDCTGKVLKATQL
jgi:UDP-N-acetyl-D-glucosamine dehydrogenase